MDKCVSFEGYCFEETNSEDKKDYKLILVKVLAILLCIFVLFQTIFYLTFLPFFSSAEIFLKNSDTLDINEVISFLELSGEETWFQFDAYSASKKLSSIPNLESVDIEKKFPNQIIINIKQREAVAIGFGTLNGRTIPLNIDKSGIIFNIGNCKIENNLPIITGLEFENPIDGMFLNYRLKPLLNDILDLKKANPVLLSSISEIKIEQKTYGGYDLTIYPVHTPVRVKTNNTLNQEGLQYMMLVLDVVEDLGLDVDEIDIRSGTVAYRIKGEKA